MNDNYNDNNSFGNDNNSDYKSEPNIDLNSWSNGEKFNSYETSYNHSRPNAHFFNQSPSHYLESKPSNSVNHKKMDRGFKAFLIAICFIAGISSLVFGASSLASYLNRNSSFTNSTENKSTTPFINTKDHTETEGTKTAEEIYQNVAPCIVGIVTYNPSAGLMSSATAQGSGIIMSDDGYIITNSHVVGNSNKYNVTVVTSDNKEYSAKVVGFDTRTDIAVLKADATGLKAAEFGNSDQIAVGSWVLALGNPGGLEFSNSLTRGLVSAVNRTLPASNSQVKFIQTDAAINPGNSGGALLNMYGQVIGVNTAKVSDYEGIGFAIPINTVKSVVDDIISKGYVSGRVKLGITVRALSAFEAQQNNVPQGIVVMEISNDSNVASQGLRAGDIITKFDDVKTISTSALYTELSKHKPGDTVKLTLYRLPATYNAQPSSLDVSVTLIEDKGENQ